MKLVLFIFVGACLIVIHAAAMGGGFKDVLLV
jgi:hypothetical protein